MRYLVLFGMGIILLPLILISLDAITGWGIMALSNYNLIIHWFIFAVLTSLISFLCKEIVAAKILRISIIVIVSSWLITLVLTWLFYNKLSRDVTGWMYLKMDYLYINLFYISGIALSLFVIKRIRSQKSSRIS